MSRKHEMSHNECSVYDYNKCRWSFQPGDILSFDDRESGCYVGEVIAVSLELFWIRRLKDNRIFVISTYDMKDWRLRRVDYIRRLPNGIFSVCESVELDGVFHFPFEEYIIEKFDDKRVLICYFVKGRVVGFFWVLHGEVLKLRSKKNEKENYN